MSYFGIISNVSNSFMRDYIIDYIGYNLIQKVLGREGDL